MQAHQKIKPARSQTLLIFVDEHVAYFGRIRTLIPETSGQRFGNIRTA